MNATELHDWARQRVLTPLVENTGRFGVELNWAWRAGVLIVRDFVSGDLNLRAMSLVYTTLLSLVPLLALSFSILKGFGAHNQLEPVLLAYLAPLGPETAQEVGDSIISFVNNMNVSVLGALGLGVLLYTVISLMQKVEGAFNAVWRVQVERSFSERFATFLSALTVGPVLIFSALAVTGSLMNNALMARLGEIMAVGTVVELVGSLIPYALVVLAFAFLYAFVPNTRVKPGAALTGALVAGVLWGTVGLVFASFAAGASRYEAIYATFASAVLFLIWTYLSWLILLIGASIAFYRQHPEIVRAGRLPRAPSFAAELEAAVCVMVALAREFYDGRTATVSALAADSGLDVLAVERTLSRLEDIGFVSRNVGEPTAFLPARPLERTTVGKLVLALLHHGGGASGARPGADAVAAFEASVSAAFADRSLEALALDQERGKRADSRHGLEEAPYTVVQPDQQTR